MKTYKKLLVGTVSLLVMGLFFMSAPKHAAADGSATLTDLINCNKTFQWQDYAHISCQLSDGQKAIFTDSNPDARDSHNHYVFAPPSGLFCGPDPTESDTYGIGQEGLVVEPNDSNAPAFSVINFNEGYLVRGKAGCNSFWDGYLNGHGGDGHGNETVVIKPSANTIFRAPKRSAIVLAGTDSGAQSLPDVTDGKFAGYSFVRWNSDYDPGGKVYLFAQNISLNTIGGDCTGDILAVTTDKNGNSTSAREYTLGTSGDPLSKYKSDLKNLPKAPTCRVSAYNFGSGDINQYPADQIYISPAIQNVAKIGAGDVTQGGPTDKNNSNSPSDGTCEASSNGVLNWLTCPLLSTAQDAANFLYDGFEKLLSFDVNQDLGNTSSQASVKKTWSLVRNLATAFLVILMLIMVFSQAISAGPFDAYTVRKMLPRLIAAAIAIQLSWAIVTWVIGIFDDLGHGIANIMYWPFGGADALKLPQLLAHAGVGTGKAFAIDYVAIGAGLVLGAAAFPTVLLLLLGAVAALFTAYFTLIMRKIIIIVLLIFAPIAMLAYVLPNTQKFWKMWYDNLIKILFMFPLIVAMIATGRIFAYIAGGQDTNSGTFLNFILVMVAFFGPLFLLPKTYKWGGQAMSAVSGAVGGISNRYLGRESSLGKGVQGFGERKQGQIAKSYNPNDKLRRRIAYRIGSGHIIPTKRNQRLAIAAGDKWSQERDEEALALIKRKGEKVISEGYATKLRMDDGSEAVYKRATGADGAQGYLDKDGMFTTDVDKAAREAAKGRVADTKTLKGTQAMKQMWVDLAEDGRNANEKKMAIRQLTATASWPELQGSFTASGKRVMDVESWGKDITTSPEDYPRVLRSRVDAAPHITDIAIKEAGKLYSDQNSVEARDFKSASRMNYAIEKQMSNEDFATQSDGFWEEAARIATYNGPDENIKEKALLIRKNLKDRFEAISRAGGTTPQQMLGHLSAGGTLQENVDKVLGEDDTVLNYLDRTGRNRDTAPPTGAA